VENLQGHNDPRTALVNKLAYLHGWLLWVEERWQQKSAIAQRYQALVPFKKKWGVLAFVLWAVGLTVASFTVASPVTAVVFNTVLGPLFTKEWIEANVGTAIMIMIATPVAVSVGLALLITMLRNKLLLPWQHSRTHRTNEQREAHNKAVWIEEQEVNAQLTQAGADFSSQIGTWYPRAYLYEEAVTFCVRAVQNHRANDISTALNLYETELHRARVEDNQAAILAEQQRTQRLITVGNVINAALAGAAIGTIRHEGARTRAASAAWIKEQIKKPRTVYVKKRW
jgi:hypothetical protein